MALVILNLLLRNLFCINIEINNILLLIILNNIAQLDEKYDIWGVLKKYEYEERYIKKQHTSLRVVRYNEKKKITATKREAKEETYS